MQAPVPSATPLPTLVIGGYLGAGKTTLVNHLLRHAGGRRLAVLVNDFGAVDIDADLIVGQAGEVLSLAGGCVCCSFGSDLVGTLMALPAREPPPDLVLIELSGVALPAAAVRSARLAAGIDVVGTLGLVDAADVLRQLADRYVGDTVLQQLRDADLLLLNKTDLVAPAALPHLRQQLRTLLPHAVWLECTMAEVPPELVLGWRDTAQAADPPPPVFPQRRIAPASGQPAGALFASRQAWLPAGTDLAVLGQALADPALGVLRAKALARDAAGQGQLLQLVGRRWSVTPSAAGASGAGRLVVIGLRSAIDGPGFGVEGLDFSSHVER